MYPSRCAGLSLVNDMHEYRSKQVHLLLKVRPHVATDVLDAWRLQHTPP